MVLKRFLLDAFCILMITILAREYMEQIEPESIDEKLIRFNQQIENNEIIDVKQSKMPLNQIEENLAGRFGETVSEMVIGFIDGSLRLISAVFTEST